MRGIRERGNEQSKNIARQVEQIQEGLVEKGKRAEQAFKKFYDGPPVSEQVDRFGESKKEFAKAEKQAAFWKLMMTNFGRPVSFGEFEDYLNSAQNVYQRLKISEKFGRISLSSLGGINNFNSTEGRALKLITDLARFEEEFGPVTPKLFNIKRDSLITRMVKNLKVLG
jgi:hypothetical protein